MATAHGKIILLGEHAVVYGVPALALGIDRGARAVAYEAREPRLTINGQVVQNDDVRQALEAISTVLRAPQLGIDVKLDIPPGSGLGASAALGVAIAGAIVEHMGGGASSERVLGAADAWERVFHGNPSGIDTAAAYYGGCLKFRRGHAPEFVTLAAPLPLAVAKAGPPASTKEMVEIVAKLRERRPDLVDKTLEGIRSLVDNALLCLEAGDFSGLGKLMDYNQMLLSGLFLSTPEIEQACTIARDTGALGAKLTGAGGGGSVIALALDPGAIVAAWQQRGIEGFVATSSSAAAFSSAPATPRSESSGD